MNSTLHTLSHGVGTERHVGRSRQTLLFDSLTGIAHWVRGFLRSRDAAAGRGQDSHEFCYTHRDRAPRSRFPEKSCHAVPRAVALFAAIWMGAPAASRAASAAAEKRAERKATNAADRAVIERIVDQWRERAEKIGTLHCVASGTATAAKGCYNGCRYLPKDVEGDVPAEDHSYTLSYDWLFDFKNARFRIEKRGELFHAQKLIYIPDANVIAFDGARKPRMLARREWNTSATHSPPEKQPEFFVERQGLVLDTPDLIGLLAHGGVPGKNTPIRPSGIGSIFSTAADFVLLGRAERNGRDCIVLRSVGKPPTNFTEYWIDERRQGAIVHWESREAQRKIFELVVTRIPPLRGLTI